MSIDCGIDNMRCVNNINLTPTLAVGKEENFLLHSSFVLSVAAHPDIYGSCIGIRNSNKAQALKRLVEVKNDTPDSKLILTGLKQPIYFNQFEKFEELNESITLNVFSFECNPEDEKQLERELRLKSEHMSDVEFESVDENDLEVTKKMWQERFKAMRKNALENNTSLTFFQQQTYQRFKNYRQKG